MNDEIELEALKNLRTYINQRLQTAEDLTESAPMVIVLESVLRIIDNYIEEEEDSQLLAPTSYEYRHIANNQYSKLKDSIVELMNEGWETFGGIEKERQAYQSETEYSQIMRRVK